MLEQYAFDLRLRALDAIQIAVALGLKSQGLVEQFVAADKVLCEVATLEGFAVLNPEHP
jgi:predicted nucleic acid-binding protein